MTRKINVNDVLIYLAGLTSTWQLLTLGGINFFTWISVVFVIFGIVNSPKIESDRKVFLFMLFIGTSLAGNLVLDKHFLENIYDWQGTCFNSSIVFMIIFLVYCILKRSDSKKLNIFFRGFYYSCCVQVFWCYLQLLVHTLCGIEINELVFAEILKMWTTIDTTNVRGQYNLVGLNLNGGILTPILLFAFINSKNRFFKVAIIALFFLSGNTTTLISGILLLFYLFYYELIIKKKITKKILVEGLTAIVLLMIVFVSQTQLLERCIEFIYSFNDRIESILTKQWTEGSTFVHYRYYESIPYIVSEIGIFRLLAGFGFRCAGMPFVIYFNQYPDIVYGTESDPVSMLYGIGLLGTIVFYSILAEIILKGKKIDRNYFLFGIIIFISGIFYSLQMNWLLLVEFLFLNAIKRNIKLVQLIDK